MKRMILVLAAFIVALPLHAGLIYDFQTVTEEGRSSSALKGTAKIEGTNLRMELSEGDGMIFKNNSVVISEDNGQTMLVLDPKKKEYYRISMEQTFSTLSNLMQSAGGMFDISIDNQKVDVRDLGAGETIQGYPTKKYVVHAEYDLNMRMMGMRRSTSIKSETETWVTDRIDVGGAAFLQQRAFKTGLEDLDSLIDKHVDAMRGFPLKSVTNMTTTAGRRTNTSKTTMTVTDVRETSIPASEFVVPSDYREIDSPMAGLENLQRR
jgi:hypothetical protein